MKVLHLTLKKQWFDMIKSGQKPEEYRDIKPYWTKRLFDSFQTMKSGKGWIYQPKSFDAICFSNGYAKDRDQITVEYRGLRVGKGIESWGADPDECYIVLKLGNRL